MLLASLALLPLLATAGATLASEGPPPILQPTDYASPSGQFVLHVDPSRRDGGGPGSYRTTRDAEPVWEQTLDVTMWRASVTDDGRVAGFGYSNGWRDHRTEGEFHVLFLDAAGEVIADDATKRVGNNYMHSPPVPVASNVWTQLELDLVRVDVAVNDSAVHTHGWTYRLSTGERMEDSIVELPIDPSSVEFIAVRQAEALPGTGQMLLRWVLRDGESTEGVDHLGSVYALRNAARAPRRIAAPAVDRARRRGGGASARSEAGRDRRARTTPRPGRDRRRRA